MPRKAMAKVGADLFLLGSKTYLLVVDYFSRYVEIAQLSHTRSTDVIVHRYLPGMVFLRSWCLTTGRKFLLALQPRIDSGHVTSSPRFPQSNGEAERAVQTEKPAEEGSRPPTWLYSPIEPHPFRVDTAQLNSLRVGVFAPQCQSFPLSWTLHCLMV